MKHLGQRQSLVRIIEIVTGGIGLIVFARFP